MTKLTMKTMAALTLFILTVCRTAPAEDAPGLKDAVVLVIRHGEKPESGNDLSAEGVERAKAYVHYFETFQLDGKPLKLDGLFATHDSKNSNRPAPDSGAVGTCVESPGELQLQEQRA